MLKTRSLGGEKPRFVAFADFPGVNTPTEAHFKLPCDISECKTGKIWMLGSYKPV